LAAGVQGLVGFSDAADRFRIGPYARWGISPKWTLLAQLDYGGFWDLESSGGRGDQVTTYLQLYYHHYEWLVSSVTANYAYSDLVIGKDESASVRYTLGARLNRNFSLGLTYAIGDTARDLGHGQEIGVFASMKF
jgi:hypothetical protein